MPDGQTCSGGIFDYDGKVEQLEEVNRELENPAVWNDQERAQELNKQRASLDQSVNKQGAVFNGLEEASELLELALEEGDDETLSSLGDDLQRIQFEPLASWGR